jgi:oligopeptidase A
MAKSQDDVINFLTKISDASKEGALKEINEIKELAYQDDINDFNSYDMAYYSEKLKKEKYSINEEYYRPYFEQDSVVKGLFEFINTLFEIKFEEIN